jgi:perosamine synthetase
MPLRVLPPGSFPLTLPSVARSALGHRDAVERFETALAARLGGGACLAISSGRAALYLALRVLSSASSRRVVVVPAYTCYTVPAAVVKAGLRVRPCDIDPETLDFDPASLRDSVRDDVLAVVAAGLYGIPADLAAVRSIASSHGAYVIDDAAQCFGAAAFGQSSGGEGDLGVTSFGRGKGLSTYEGGALVSRDPEHVRAARALLGAEASSGHGGSVMLKAVGYSVFQRPRLYGLIRRIPALKLGVTVFDPGFEVGPLGRFQAALGLEALTIVDRVIAARRQSADFYVGRLDSVRGLARVRVPEGRLPVWLRFPLLAASRDIRERFLAGADAAGLGVSASYPRAVTQIPELAAGLAEPNPSCPERRESPGPW